MENLVRFRIHQLLDEILVLKLIERDEIDDQSHLIDVN